MSMHAADPRRSDRLKRVLRFLRERGSRGATTMEIIRHCNVCAVNAIVPELRVAGYLIPCKQRFVRGAREARYTLKRGRAG